MLLGETVAVYHEKHMENTNTLCGQDVEFWYITASGTDTNHVTSRGYAVMFVT
jgi:hypothetical protein